jgi:hypothetical protein
LVAAPLLLWYNRESLPKFIGGTAVMLAATNLPFFLYGGIGEAFLNSVFSGHVISQMYLYEYIPLYAILSLTVLEFGTLLYNRRKHN